MASGFGNYPANYLLFNAELSKNLVIIMEIEDVPQIFGISPTFSKVTYGTPGLFYGEPGLVYGALQEVAGISPWIVLDAGMTISQKIEPEQGKGNIGTLTMTLLDVGGAVSQIIAPGIVVDEIMMSKEVKIWIGFTQTSFPQDYLLIFRGYISQVSCPPGVVRFQLSDGTSKKRQPIFNTPSTLTTSAIDNVVTTIPVLNTIGFHQQILGPDGTFDPLVSTYIQIDTEWMKYAASGGIVDDTHFLVTRGQFDSSGLNPAVAHDIGATVTNGVQFGTGPGIHFIDYCLKILLSGWNGPCETGIALTSITFQSLISPYTYLPNAFVLGDEEADTGLGLTIGDYFTISGASNGANDLTGQIIAFLNDDEGRLRVIQTDQSFSPGDNPTPATVAFRSQYDTLPVTCGVGCRMRDVDVATFQYVKATYFTLNSNIRIFYNAPIQAKDSIDTDVLLPMGCYGISRYGRISMSVTKPPLPGIGKLVELNADNVIDPQNITITRSINSRSFYNLISVEYDFDPGTNTFDSIQYFLDTESQNTFQQTSQLPIVAPGLASDLAGSIIAQARANALLLRYGDCAITISLTVFWGVGSLIEVSDIVVLNDSGNLQIMNFQTGERNLGVQMFEVIDRQYNVVAGNVKLTLLGGLGFNINSRFGLIAPSTILNINCTTTSMKLTPSFGQTSLTNELAKWIPFFGLPIQVHNFDYSVTGVTTMVSVDPSDPTAILCDPPLGFTPAAGDIMEIAAYPTDGNPKTNSKYKALYGYITPTLAITSGVSATSFNVSLVDAAKMTVGNTIIVRNSDYSTQSHEVVVLSIVGTLVTTKTTLGFTPSSAYFCEGIGFNDSLGYYRYE